MTDTTHFLIDGRWVAPEGRALIDVENPATEEVVARVALRRNLEIGRAHV